MAKKETSPKAAKLRAALMKRLDGLSREDMMALPIILLEECYGFTYLGFGTGGSKGKEFVTAIHMAKNSRAMRRSVLSIADSLRTTKKKPGRA